MLSNQAFFYLRHGETDWNLSRRVQGQTDIPLNTNGIRQAEAACSLLAGQEIPLICSSPLSRARVTAGIVNRVLGVPIEIIEDLREANWGDHEGLVRGQWFTDWLKGVTPWGAESYKDFIARATAGINAALARAENVLIVSHGGVYRAIRAHARLAGGDELGNCVPIHHRPPDPGHPWWTAEVVGP